MQNYPYSQYFPKDYIEVVDDNDQPILLQRYENAKHLPHRSISIIFKDNQNKVLMLQDKTNASQHLGFLQSYVLAGEARESTLLRLIAEHLPTLAQLIEENPSIQIFENMRYILGKKLITNVNVITEDSEQMLLQELDNTTFFIIPLQEHEKTLLSQDLLWLDFDELNGLAKHFSSLLEPRILYFTKYNYLNEIFT